MSKKEPRSGDVLLEMQANARPYVCKHFWKLHVDVKDGPDFKPIFGKEFIKCSKCGAIQNDPPSS